MIWTGSAMVHHTGGYTQTDPALINPRLPVDMRSPDWAGETIGYWPSYEGITARQRAAYLSWLAHGRRAPGVSISYVFLFFYGLERRVLDVIDLDTASEPTVGPELFAVAQELAALREVYGHTAGADYQESSFDRYASSLLDVINALLATVSPDLPTVPASQNATWQLPSAAKVALGRMARDGTPVSPKWALAWASLHPQIYSRTPQRRCPDEFEALFKARYGRRYAGGIRLRSVKKRLTLDYYPASSITRTKPVELDIPDVTDQERPVRELSALVEETNNDLDAFSRWIGRHPEDTSSLAALATLPRDLLEPDANPDLAKLLEWANKSLGEGKHAVVDSRSPLVLWGGTKLAKSDAVALANLLGQFDFGIEPDVRCGGPVLAPGPMVVFRTTPATPTVAGPGYAAATLVAHLGVAVADADGHIDASEIEKITFQLRGAFALSDGERSRLDAHIAWLSATGVKLTGLRKRLEPLGADERESLADFVASVAAADGVITPTESKAVDKIHVLLGLDPATAARRLHEAMTERSQAAPPASEPVTVRPASRPAPGHPIPSPSPATSSEPTVYSGRHAHPSPPPARAVKQGFVLDEAAIALKRADTARVTSLLTRIFDDEDTDARDSSATTAAGDADAFAVNTPEARFQEEPLSPSDALTDPVPRTAGTPTVIAASPAPSAGVELTAALGVEYRQLLYALAQRASWYRVEFDRQAQGIGLDPTTALELLNAASVNACGHALITGEQRLTIDPNASTTLLAAPESAAVAPPGTSAPSDASRPGRGMLANGSSSGDHTALTTGRCPGLDEAHNALLGALESQSTWFRVQFENLAAEHGLLPDAAFETLNDAALDACDDLLLDGEERLNVNRYALRKMVT